MRKQIKLTVEIGDANYVKPGEYFAILAPDGKTIVSLQRREDDLSMTTIAATPVPTETKTGEIDLKTAAAGDKLEITPTTGKTMSKVTINVVDTTEDTSGTE